MAAFYWTTGYTPPGHSSSATRGSCGASDRQPGGRQIEGIMGASLHWKVEDAQGDIFNAACLLMLSCFHRVFPHAHLRLAVSDVLMFATCATCHVSTIDSRAPATCTSASVLVAAGSLEAGPASHALTDSSTPYRY